MLVPLGGLELRESELWSTLSKEKQQKEWQLKLRQDMEVRSQSSGRDGIAQDGDIYFLPQSDGSLWLTEYRI